MGSPGSAGVWRDTARPRWFLLETVFVQGFVLPASQADNEHFLPVYFSYRIHFRPNCCLSHAAILARLHAFEDVRPVTRYTGCQVVGVLPWFYPFNILIRILIFI